MIRTKLQALRRARACAIGILGLGLAGCGSDPSGPDYSQINPIVFSRDIQPILSMSCNTSLCHNATDSALGLTLESYATLAAGSDFGSMVIPFQPDRSHFYLHLTGGIEPQMPLARDPLDAQVIEFFRRWIAEGARDDGGTPMGSNAVEKAFVACQGENTVAVIDTETGLIARHLEVDQPHSVFVDPLTRRLYVSRFVTATDNVHVYDADTYALLATGRAGTFPALLLAARPTGHPEQLWVTNFDTVDHAVRVLNPGDLSEIDSFTVASSEQPHGLAINADETRVYVTNILTDNITIFGTDPPRVVEQNLALPDIGTRHQPQQCVLSPDGSRLFVSALGTDKVYVLDVTEPVGGSPVTASVDVGDGPWHLALSPSGNELWVANWLGESVTIVDVSSPDSPQVVVPNLQANHPADPDRSVVERPIGIAFSDDGTRVYLANANDDNQGAGHHPPPEGEKNPGSVTVFDATTRQVIYSSEVPNFARFVSLLP